MPEANLFPRFAKARLKEALADTPVILIHGPRQSGKTTLARSLERAGSYKYITFDNDVARGAAEADPTGFIADLGEKTILDEVQRVPGIFTAIKTVVDRDRSPGRFLLTGSANVLLLPKLADSLAGRMEIIRLHPLSESEIEGKQSTFLDDLFEGTFKRASKPRLGDNLLERIAKGGYPVAVSRSTQARRSTWYRDYVEAIVQRDVRDMARIASLDALTRLMSLTASQTARLLNVSDLSAPFQLSRPTIRDYVTLLERVFLLEELPPWHSNRLSRLIKTPKLHIGDTGLCCALLGISAKDLSEDRGTLGQLLETFVFQELRRQSSWRSDDIRFHHFRDKDGVEIDIVLERGTSEICGIEVKASGTVTAADFRGIRKLASASGAKFRGGVVLYDGELAASFGDRMYAVPIRALWENH
jgi:predicted AAA+ superfamily ATPase